jgi:hypothetical protein
MNPEVRKEYNKKYYTENKEAILEKALKKVECQFCLKQVIQNNISKHQQTKLCKNRQEKNKINKERSEM